MKKIAVIGSGAVGLYYGARLAQAGNEVHFLARRDFDALKKGGLTVESKDGDFRIEKPLVHRESREIGGADWIICALKGTALDSARELIEPVATSGARLLVLMNGIGMEEWFSEWFAHENIFSGIAFTCINRGDLGAVRHLDYGAVTVGHFRGEPEKTKEAKALWDGAKVEVLTTNNILRDRWIKQCWNVPFSGIGVLYGGKSTQFIMGSPTLCSQVENAQREIVEIANADLRATGSTETIDADETVAKMMENTRQMEDYSSSTVLDFLAGRPMEVDIIFSETLRRARKYGVAAPNVEAIVTVIEAFQTLKLRGDRV
ncbi:2-dehydropantoate 2-reductase [Candidatus Mycalebacterium sp.]